MTGADRPPDAGSGTVRTGTDLPGVAPAWAALDGDEALLERISCTTREGLLPARLPVMDLARATVAVCSLAAAELSSRRFAGSGSGEGRGAAGIPAVRLDDGAVATAFTSERHLRTDGNPPVNFAPLSRFWRTADGWLRTHANYPHHRTRLLSALGLTQHDGDEAALVEAVAAELAQRAAAEVEETVHAAGGLAVAARAPREWAEHPHGAQTVRNPLLKAARIDQAPPLPLPEPAAGRGALHSVRVLDLTRVIAGPVATRTLALFGADVLRIDAPQLPERPEAHADTGPGKRSTLLDLSSRADQATFEELLSAAHVVVTGYRPGVLDRFGLAPESLADRRPGIVVGQLSAWGSYGPWRRRRGFDSLVQTASGIALTEGRQDADGSRGADERAPGALPAQALDHGTGYLLAAAVLRALTEQRQGRVGSRLLRLALAQTANWLQNGLTSGDGHGHGPEAPDDHDPAPWLTETDSPLGRLRYALPPVGYEGAPTDWASPPGMPGSDPAAWW
ncbi:CoA transferase [Streptomyces albidus (ex Kaewkla and Franco 2022)]|uniref:CoA transferase n=1 Tax=Streptomyces albidus (ex Kaewkla and Franco 2022) TaxID=722709 RepID=UPI0015EEBBD0|nr:CoA transferase [Streptomyces albidus (ex Kaewkla and Franco 2022)]